MSEPARYQGDIFHDAIALSEDLASAVFRVKTQRATTDELALVIAKVFMVCDEIKAMVGEEKVEKLYAILKEERSAHHGGIIAS